MKFKSSTVLENTSGGAGKALFQRFLRKSQRERDEKDDHILQSWENTNPSQVERNSGNTHTEFPPTDSHVNSKLTNQGITGTEGRLGHYSIDDGIILYSWSS